MSLFSEYKKEREKQEVFEDEYGFITYSFTPDVCYIADLYVKPEFRHSRIATTYADKVTSIAREKGYKTLLGSICLNTENTTESMKALLYYGFKLSHLHEATNMIYLTKEIG